MGREPRLRPDAAAPRRDQTQARLGARLRQRNSDTRTTSRRRAASAGGESADHDPDREQVPHPPAEDAPSSTSAGDPTGAVVDAAGGSRTNPAALRVLVDSLKVRPIFLHNDDRIHALVSIVGIALLIFGLIESRTRQALADDELLPGLLPEGRAAKPTGRNILGAFQGLALTYTQDGIVLDRLTHTQRRTLELLQIPLPWPEQGQLALANCGKRG